MDTIETVITIPESVFRERCLALSSEIRLRIVSTLRLKKIVSGVTLLGLELQVGQSTVSHHLQKLIDAGLVIKVKNGNEAIMSLNEQSFFDMMNYIYNVFTTERFGDKDGTQSSARNPSGNSDNGTGGSGQVGSGNDPRSPGPTI